MIAVLVKRIVLVVHSQLFVDFFFFMHLKKQNTRIKTGMYNNYHRIIFFRNFYTTLIVSESKQYLSVILSA